jgi:hypothetical protein
MILRRLFLGIKKLNYSVELTDSDTGLGWVQVERTRCGEHFPFGLPSAAHFLRPIPGSNIRLAGSGSRLISHQVIHGANHPNWFDWYLFTPPPPYLPARRSQLESHSHHASRYLFSYFQLPLFFLPCYASRRPPFPAPPFSFPHPRPVSTYLLPYV